MSIIFKKPTETEFSIILADMKKQFPYMSFTNEAAYHATLRRDDYAVWLAQHQEGDKIENAGYMMVWLDRKKKVGWLLFIAVFSHFQGRGFGSLMLNKLKDFMPGWSGVVAELEKPNPQDLNSMRRIKFYTAKGAFPLNFRYFLPQPNKLVPMDLYFLPFQDDLKSVPNKLILDSVGNYLEIVYGNNPLTERALSQITPLP